MRSKLYSGLTQRQVDVLCRIYAHCSGERGGSNDPLYFEIVSTPELIKTWHPLIGSKLVTISDSSDWYDPPGRVLFARLTSRGNRVVGHFLRAVRKASIEQLPVFLASEIDLIRREAAKRML